MRYAMIILALAGFMNACTYAGPMHDGCSSEKAAKVSLTSNKDIVDTAVAAGSFNTLVTAVKAAHLVETLKGDGPFTVFAPTDEAFAQIPSKKLAELLEPKNRDLLSSILTYHVVPGRVAANQVVTLENATTANGQRVDITVKGDTVMIDGATVVTADIPCKNGVIHVIDRVIMPATSDIVDTAVAAGSFKTLTRAVGAADLVGTLKSKGPFTVFAPNDEAFANLPEGTLAALLTDAKRGDLASILTFHVVPGRVYADQVLAAKSLTSVEGSPISIKTSGGQVFVGGARVLKTDIESSNGVIHVIDSVILPPARN